jgi:hypothetical protein
MVKSFILLIFLWMMSFPSSPKFEENWCQILAVGIEVGKRREKKILTSFA